ncbi:MAG: NAD-dependent epimerase/dehydratase family protein, partial [Acidimicrobiia bacterium]
MAVTVRIVITGVAGFVGSTTAAMALDAGMQVLGIDCFTPYYSREIKEANIAFLSAFDRFSLVEGNLLKLDLPGLLTTCDGVLHLAAQPGVRHSWSEFDT